MDANILNNTTQCACICYLAIGIILGKITHFIYKKIQPIIYKNENI